MIDVEINVQFSAKKYQSFLKRLKKFCTLVATVGIHPKEGNKKVYHRYSTISKGKSVTKITGKSHRMTVMKLAYQNEFGTTIPIRPRYITLNKKEKQIIHTRSTRITRTTTTKYSVLRNAREQGYLLLDKRGKFVAYFRPNSKITIPERSFLRKTAKNIKPYLSTIVAKIIEETLVNRTMNQKTAITKIAKLIQYRVQNNMVNSKPNHPLTFKAKGNKTPLLDEEDRLRKAVKYKVFHFTQAGALGLQGNAQYLKLFENKVDKLLKSASEYEKLATEITKETKVFKYKYGNPHVRSIMDSMSDSQLNTYINTLAE